MRKAIVLLTMLLLISEAAYASHVNDAVEMKPDDLSIGNFEYRFEPEGSPTMLKYFITVTNVTDKTIKYKKNVYIRDMSQFVDSSDKCNMILESGQSCIVKGYGFLSMSRGIKKEYEIIKPGTYTIQVTLSPSNVHPNVFKEEEDGIIKKKFHVSY